MPIRPVKPSRWRRLAIGLAIFTGLTCAAYADPLVKMDNGQASPGVITRWEGSGKKILLTVKEGVDAKDVADAINEEVENVRAKVKAGKVQVKGKSQADLLSALANVDYGSEDFGALADAEMGDDDEGSGSSLRAKKAADLAKLFKDAKTTAIGKVVSVKYHKFPRVTVKVRILRGPKGKLGKKIRKGKKIDFNPALTLKGKGPKWSHEDTQVNAGAWFLRKGDKVNVKIGKKMKGGFEAKLISRQ